MPVCIKMLLKILKYLNKLTVHDACVSSTVGGCLFVCGIWKLFCCSDRVQRVQHRADSLDYHSPHPYTPLPPPLPPRRYVFYTFYTFEIDTEERYRICRICSAHFKGWLVHVETLLGYAPTLFPGFNSLAPPLFYYRKTYALICN